jgi:hypothetical protein
MKSIEVAQGLNLSASARAASCHLHQAERGG